MRLNLAILISISILGNVNGQRQDFRTWWSVNLSKELSKDLKAGLEVGQRFHENSLRYDRSLATLSAEYKFHKNFAVEAGYRLILLQEDELYLTSKQRVHGNISYAYKLSQFKFKFRERLQYGYDDLNLLNEIYFNKLTNRNKISIDYDIFGLPLSVNTSYELFTDLNNPNGASLSGHRFQAGLNILLNSKADIDIHYMMDFEVNEVNPLRSYIFEVSLTYKL